MGSPKDARAAGTPLGINVAAGAGALVTCVFVANTLIPPSLQLTAVALAVVGFVVLVGDTRAGLATTGLGFLLFNGFLVNRYGELTWGGKSSMWQLAVFALAVGLGLGLRWMYVHRSKPPRVMSLGALLDLVESKPNEKELHGA